MFRIYFAHQRGVAMPVTEIKNHVYKILELVGSSEKSVEDAIQNAITRASKTIREMKWFEVVAISKKGLSDITRSLCESDSHSRNSFYRRKRK